MHAGCCSLLFAVYRSVGYFAPGILESLEETTLQGSVYPFVDRAFAIFGAVHEEACIACFYVTFISEIFKCPSLSRPFRTLLRVSVCFLLLNLKEPLSQTANAAGELPPAMQQKPSCNASQPV